MKYACGICGDKFDDEIECLRHEATHPHNTCVKVTLRLAEKWEFLVEGPLQISADTGGRECRMSRDDGILLWIAFCNMSEAQISDARRMLEDAARAWLMGQASNLGGLRNNDNEQEK